MFKQIKCRCTIPRIPEVDSKLISISVHSSGVARFIIFFFVVLQFTIVTATQHNCPRVCPHLISISYYGLLWYHIESSTILRLKRFSCLSRPSTNCYYHGLHTSQLVHVKITTVESAFYTFRLLSALIKHWTTIPRIPEVDQGFLQTLLLGSPNYFYCKHSNKKPVSFSSLKDAARRIMFPYFFRLTLYANVYSLPYFVCFSWSLVFISR